MRREDRNGSFDLAASRFTRTENRDLSIQKPEVLYHFIKGMNMDATNVISNVVVIGIRLFVWRSLDTRISQLDKRLSERIDHLDERVSQIEERIAHLGERISRIEGLFEAFVRKCNPFETDTKN